MAVYNGQRFLGQAIDSILNQTYRNFELIIVNDHSTDDTKQIIEYFKARDSRIINIDNSERKGQTVSANLGIKIAKGDYIARMDADDISLPTRFEKQIGFLEGHAEIGLLGTNGYYIEENGRRSGLIRHYENDLGIRWGDLFNNQYIHSSIMFRRSLLLLAGSYNNDYRYAEDYEFLSRLLKFTKGANLKEKLVYWRKSFGGITSQKAGEIFKFGTQIAKVNINELFGYDFVHSQDEMQSFRALYQGSYTCIKDDQISGFLKILERFKQKHGITAADEKWLNKTVASRIFESLYKKGFNKTNLKYLQIIIKISPVAVIAGLWNLGQYAIKKAKKRIAGIYEKK